eukprot:gene6097-10104_t
MSAKFTIGPPTERNQEATIYVGNLDQQVSEEIVWELFLQVGSIVNCYIPKDRVTQTHSGYGFVEFKSTEDADYAVRVMNSVKLFGKPIRINKASQDKKNLQVGANLFVGNLDPSLDEKQLYDTFSVFGNIITTPQIQKDLETGESRGFAFLSFDSFEAADQAIDGMNGQFLSGKQITVDYALKENSKTEKHGSMAERLLAANNPSIYQPLNQKQMQKMYKSQILEHQ